jgi:hypothetical protein
VSYPGRAGCPINQSFEQDPTVTPRRADSASTCSTVKRQRGVETPSLRLVLTRGNRHTTTLQCGETRWTRWVLQTVGLRRWQKINVQPTLGGHHCVPTEKSADSVQPSEGGYRQACVNTPLRDAVLTPRSGILDTAELMPFAVGEMGSGVPIRQGWPRTWRCERGHALGDGPVGQWVFRLAGRLDSPPGIPFRPGTGAKLISESDPCRGPARSSC